MNPAFLADVIVVVHFAIVLFVILGLFLVILGGALRWSWVRNPVFRLTHLGLIAFIAIQGTFDRICPLTIWEHDLRVRARQEAVEGSFIGRLCREWLYVDVPQESLNRAYVVFALVVASTFLFVRPRRFRARRGDAG